MHLAIQALSLASLQACHSNIGVNISNMCKNIVKNPNWQEADQLAIYKAHIYIILYIIMVCTHNIDWEVQDKDIDV